MPVLDDTEWSVLHGDTAHSPLYAVLTDDEKMWDLTGWSVFAHARDDEDAPHPRHGWSLGDGVDIGVATIDTRRGRVRTSTVQLYMRPADYADIPRRWSGLVDVEIASDATAAPAERHTIVRFPFTVSPDVTW